MSDEKKEEKKPWRLRVQVQKGKLAWFGNRRRREGERFFISKPIEFSAHWMIAIDKDGRELVNSRGEPYNPKKDGNKPFVKKVVASEDEVIDGAEHPDELKPQELDTAAQSEEKEEAPVSHEPEELPESESVGAPDPGVPDDGDVSQEAEVI